MTSYIITTAEGGRIRASMCPECCALVPAAALDAHAAWHTPLAGLAEALEARPLAAMKAEKATAQRPVKAPPA